MSSLEFLQRLASLVPLPRLHLIRFHGVLAPNAKLRFEIIPSPPEHATEHLTDHAHAQGAPARMSLARLLKRVFEIDIENYPNWSRLSTPHSVLNMFHGHIVNERRSPHPRQSPGQS